MTSAQGDDMEIEDITEKAIDDQIELEAAELFAALAADVAAERPSLRDGVPRVLQGTVSGSFEGVGRCQ
jgi:hypothetical protein